MGAALDAGISFDDFFAATPWMVGRMIEAALHRDQFEQKKATALAWQTARFAGPALFGKLPPLSNFIKDKPGPEQPQSPEMQMAVLKVLTDRMLRDS